MSFEAALQTVQILASLALLQRGFEHLCREPLLFLPQIVLASLLLVGIADRLVVVGLWACGLWQLHRFDGPYNGGSDKMLLLLLTCLAVAHIWPDLGPVALGYLAVQLVLSYFVSGWVKLRSPAWRDGRALAQVFAVSSYPTSEALRHWACRPVAMRVASWGVIGFEVLFPLSLLNPMALAAALVFAAAFHLANAALFGLNRFVWAWLSAFPALIWFQTRLPF